MSATTPTVTSMQRKILAFIQTSMSVRGYPPTVREIAAHVELSSSSSAQHQLRQLELKGYIRRDPQRARAITLQLPEVAA